MGLVVDRSDRPKEVRKPVKDEHQPEQHGSAEHPDTRWHNPEQLLKAVFESVQDGISVLDSDLNIRHVNHAMRDWYGANRPLTGKKCYQAFGNRDAPCPVCPSLRCMETGKSEREIVHGLPGSSAQWLELCCYPLKDPQTGTVTGVVEFVRDVTQRRKAEQTLREREKQLAAVLETQREMICRFRADTTLTYVNEAYCRYFGRAAEELIGTKFLDLRLFTVGSG